MSIPQTQQEFVEFWGRMAPRWGISEDVGRVLSFLYLTEEPYNAAELSDALAVSKPRVRKALEPLTESDSVEVVEVEGMRGDYYLCTLEAWEVVWRLSYFRGKAELAEGVAALEGMVARGKRDADLPEYEQHRIAEALRWCRFIGRALEDMHKLPALHLHGVTQLTKSVAGFFGLK